MKSLLLASIVVALSAPVLATEVTASLSIGQPGFYGQIDIGDYPPPQLIYRQPMIIEPILIEPPPIYLRVPPGHAKNWRKHCHEYNACGERVYFVQNNWYQREYVPRYQERNGYRHEEYRELRHDERRDEYREDNRNEHKGKGHGKKDKD